MAEPIAVVGVIASIGQLIDFSGRILCRFEEFQAAAGEIPKSFCQISIEIPLLKSALEDLNEALDRGSFTAESEDALLPVLSGCRRQMGELDSILSKLVCDGSESWQKRVKKVIGSMRCETTVENIRNSLGSYIAFLTFHCAVTSSVPSLDQTKTDIRRWLASPDPSTNYHAAFKLHQANTGTWLLEGESYKKWIANATKALWLYGIPGCGKTVLSAIVIHDLLIRFQNDPGKFVIYFFFDFNDPEKLDAEKMIRSFLCQLLLRHRRVPEGLDALYVSCDTGQQQPQLQHLLEALQSTVEECPWVFMVIDALDEKRLLAERMEILETIIQWRLPNLSLLLTSRKERDIETSLDVILEPEARICLESTLVDKDIHRYVQHRLLTDKALQKWEKDNPIKEEIGEALMKGSHGMFRWAVCQLDALGKCRNRVMVRKTLQSLPHTINQTYDRILSSISEEDSEYAVRILRWLTFSAVPLSSKQLVEAIAIDIDRDPAFDPDEIFQDSKDVFNICSSLVATHMPRNDEQDHWWPILSHSSVIEYLTSEKVSKGPAAKYYMQSNVGHGVIAIACLRYLLQLQRPLTATDLFPSQSTLSHYCAKFWTFHASRCHSLTPKVNKLAEELFCDDNLAYQNYVRLWNPEDLQQRSDDEIAEPLYYASYLNSIELAIYLLDTGAGINASRTGHGGTPLQASSRLGHLQMVNLLLDRGADPNAYNGTTALLEASLKSCFPVMEVLLKKGARLKIKDCNVLTSLECEDEITFIRDTAPDMGPDTPSSPGCLEDLAYNGFTSALELLFQRKALIPSEPDFHGRSLLHLAARGGKLTTFRYLLDLPLDPTATDAKGESLLHYAASSGSVEMLDFVLNLDSPCNIEKAGIWSPLHWACRSGCIEVAERLLQAGFEDNKLTAGQWQEVHSPFSIGVLHGQVSKLQPLIHRLTVDHEVRNLWNGGEDPVDCSACLFVSRRPIILGK